MPRALPRLAALVITGAVLGLAACAAQSPDPEPTPTTDAADAPLFANDEEALAAAVEAYEAYLDVEHRIMGPEQAPISSIRPVTTDSFGDELAGQYEELRAAGLHLEGTARIDSARLAQIIQDSTAQATLYACSDVSHVRVIDKSGEDVTPVRIDRVPVIIELETKAMLVAGSTTWTGDDFC
ncbi:hypothetical protein [Agromyces sp. SYSU T00266]|uniref:hypothetical protein n=1 Tax=Agromyces zhanjiangensis TaxID=3158562 RepID=UPI00339412FF